MQWGINPPAFQADDESFVALPKKQAAAPIEAAAFNSFAAPDSLVCACPFRKTGTHFSGTCALLRHRPVATDVDARRSERTVFLLGGGQHRERRARLQIGLAADLVADDRHAWRYDDLLLPVLVFDHHARAVH